MAKTSMAASAIVHSAISVRIRSFEKTANDIAINSLTPSLGRAEEWSSPTATLVFCRASDEICHLPCGGKTHHPCHVVEGAERGLTASERMKWKEMSDDGRGEVTHRRRGYGNASNVMEATQVMLVHPSFFARRWLPRSSTFLRSLDVDEKNGALMHVQ